MAVETPENGIESVRPSGVGSQAAPTQAPCPYCGHRQFIGEECEACHGLFDPLSRQATQNQMGPWFVRNERNPFAPGMSYDRVRQMAQRGRLRRDSVIRGPATRQFWTLACNTPGIACLLGECHNCHGAADADEYMCRTCGVVLSWSSDRQHLGLSPIKLLPGEAPAAEVASSGMGGGDSRPRQPMSMTGAAPSADVASWSGSVTGSPEVAPTRAPGTAATSAHRAEHPARESTAESPRRRRSTSQARKRRDIAQRNTLIAVIVFSAVVVVASLIAVFGFGVGVGPAPAAQPTAPQGTATSQSPAEAVPVSPEAQESIAERNAAADDWLPAEVELALSAWAADLGAARERSQSEDHAEVARSIETLKRVLTEARVDASVGPEVVVALEARIDALQARADALRLRELVGDE